jgi:hypothetical protein
MELSFQNYEVMPRYLEISFQIYQKEPRHLEVPASDFEVMES